jgi:hypothetical protein
MIEVAPRESQALRAVDDFEASLADLSDDD